MIRTKAEYQNALKRRSEEKAQLKEYRANLKRQNISEEMIKKAIQPYESFRMNLIEEIEEYERIKRGKIDDIHHLTSIGQRLIGIRICLGLSQRELAQKLGVHETQVSRDERNEYHGITVERVDEILSALGVSMKSSFEMPSSKESKE